MALVLNKMAIAPIAVDNQWPSGDLPKGWTWESRQRVERQTVYTDENELIILLSLGYLSLCGEHASFIHIHVETKLPLHTFQSLQLLKLAS